METPAKPPAPVLIQIHFKKRCPCFNQHLMQLRRFCKYLERYDENTLEIRCECSRGCHTKREEGARGDNGSQ